MITEVFAPEPQEVRFLTKPEVADFLMHIRLGVLSGDVVGAAEALNQLADRLVAEDELRDRMEAESEGWIFPIH